MEHQSTTVLLTGRWLTAARTIWLVIATLSIGLFVAGVPYRYRQLLEVCNEANCAFGQLSPGELLALMNVGLSPTMYAAYDVAIATFSAAIFCVVAFVIFWRGSRERIVLLVSLWLITFGTSGEAPHALATSQPLLLPLRNFLGDLGWVFLLPLFLLTFPDGRFIPRWTRWLFVVFLVLSTVGPMIEFFFPRLANEASETMIPQVLWFSTMSTGVGVQIYRYRRSSGAVQRQQTKWVVYGLAITALGLAAWFVLGIRMPTSQAGLSSLLLKLAEMTLVTSMFGIVALTIGFSILRYRLWDVDLLIRRTIVYGVLTTFLALIYFGSVALLQALFSAVSDQNSPIIIVISTLIIAALFAPVRRRVQGFIDRRFYRRKYDAATTLTAFAAMARDEVDLDHLSAELISVVEETMQPESVTLWLREE